MYLRISSETWLVIFGSLLALLLRVCTSLHSYSGEAKPPMYGDYEAQRHWMEITTNLPINKWYHNGSDNDLNYWGLDYPPLTAYHMYVCGKVAERLNPNYTKLFDSRGFESDEHKLFMRYTVIIGDLLVYMPALIVYYYTCINNCDLSDVSVKKKKIKSRKLSEMDVSLCTILGLLYPGLILIDHGHFQYNSISLGLFVVAVIFIIKNCDILASIFFCLALNYKQMELYHALPFFFYLLSSCVPKPGQKTIYGVFRLFKIGVAVLFVFGCVWIPFLFDINDFMQVFRRLFPVARGVFEDKVSNVWCTLNVPFKFKLKFNNEQMMRLCLFTTITSLLPSCVDLFLRPSKNKFVLSQINCALSFFLFSYHVHEKSILLVSIPVLLHFPRDPFTCYWFLCISIFNMTPLLIKDNLIIPLVSLTIFYCVIFRVSIERNYKNNLNIQDGIKEYYKSLLSTLLEVEYHKKINIIATLKVIVKNTNAIRSLIFHCCMFLSLIGCLVLFVISFLIKPPLAYPDLFPLMISVYCCVHFLGFLIYFNVKQLKIPQQFDDIRIDKLKVS